VDGTLALPLTRIVRQNDIATFSTLRFIAAVGSLSERRDGIVSLGSHTAAERSQTWTENLASDRTHYRRLIPFFRPRGRSVVEIKIISSGASWKQRGSRHDSPRRQQSTPRENHAHATRFRCPGRTNKRSGCQYSIRLDRWRQNRRIQTSHLGQNN